MTHPRSVAVSSLLGRAEYFLSAGRFSAQTDYGGWVWKHEACSIFLLPPPPSPQTSPIYNKEGKLSFNSRIQEIVTLLCVCAYLADSFHSNSPPSCCNVSISVNIVGVGVLSSSPSMWRSLSAAGDTTNRGQTRDKVSFRYPVYPSQPV